MIAFMESHPKVGMIMPQILNEDGTIQNLPKLLPSPFSVLMRKIKKPHCIYQEFINRYELRFVNKNITYNTFGELHVGLQICTFLYFELDVFLLEKKYLINDLLKGAVKE